MSHTVSIKAQVKCQTALAATCLRLGLPAPNHGQVRLFDQIATGTGVQLPGWRFPLCITSDGSVLHDHFQGLWGEPKELSRFLQAYATEAAKLQARRQGHSVTETQLADGTIQLIVELGA